MGLGLGLGWGWVWVWVGLGLGWGLGLGFGFALGHRRVVGEEPGAAQWHGCTEERGRHAPDDDAEPEQPRGEREGRCPPGVPVCAGGRRGVVRGQEGLRGLRDDLGGGRGRGGGCG